MRADFGDLRGKVRGDLGLHARDAFARNVVNESAAALDDQFHAVFRRRRRNQINVAKPRLFHQCLVVFRFFRRQIQGEQAIHAGRGGGATNFSRPCLWMRLK